jgi:dihydroorotate dehydrogenase (NAD+) catalytic subunit
MRTDVDLAPGRGAGLRLANPIIVAAGGGGFGAELLEATGEQAPGAVITRGVTFAPDRGHPPPRMHLLSDGLLHSIGTPNPGLEAVLRRHGPRWAAFATPVVVNICGHDADELAAMARTLETHPEAAGLELDLACGDRSRGGSPILFAAAAAEAATVVVRAATELPLIVKLSAAVPDIRPLARAVVAAGADAISATGPLPAVALDDDRAGPRLGTTYGWLSGPALKSIGLRAVYEIAQAVRVPIIGVGGVASVGDVLDYLAAGATAVGLATAALADPSLPGRLGSELASWCLEHDTRPSALVGRALPRRRDRGSLRARPLKR